MFEFCIIKVLLGNFSRADKWQPARSQEKGGKRQGKYENYSVRKHLSIEMYISSASVSPFTYM